MPESKIHRYEGSAVAVTYDVARCIHAGECVRGLPTVFDSKAKPWVNPDAAGADALRTTIERCPSGALKLADRDGRSMEAMPLRNAARVTANGPNYLVGDLALQGADGAVAVSDTRMALCRCGGSGNKPFCDGTHRKNGFAHDGALSASVASPEGTATNGQLVIKPIVNGPLKCMGPLTTVGTNDATAFADPTFLCRCGHSHNKPYCDGTHKRIGFTS